MKKMLLIVLSFLLSWPSLAAEPEIKAFGGLGLKDGLLETVAATRKFKATSMTLTSNIGPPRSVELNQADGPESIKAALKKLIEESFSAMMKAKKHKASALHKYHGIDYLSPEFQKKTYLMRDYALTAEPINIKGVPFKMTIELSPHPGHELVNPKQVFSLEIHGKTYYFPMTVTQIKLFSDSPALAQNDREKQKLIVQALKAKFDKLKIRNRRWTFMKRNGYLDAVARKRGLLSLEFLSEECGQFDSCAGGMYMRLTYDYSQSDMEKLYTRHKLNSKKDKAISKDAPDLGDGL